MALLWVFIFCSLFFVFLCVVVPAFRHHRAMTVSLAFLLAGLLTMAFIYWATSLEAELLNERGKFYSMPAADLAAMPWQLKNAWDIDVPPFHADLGEYDTTFTGAPSEWYLLSVAQADVPRFKRAVISRYSDASNRDRRFLVKAATPDECYATANSHSPSWWKPETIVDADPVKIGPYPFIVFIFSEKNGTVHLFVSGH